MHAPPSPTTLSQHQLQVWDQLMHFLEGRGEQVFVLKGYAGTGKTYLLKHLVDHLVHDSWFLPILLAPTGRAAEVLRRVSGHEARTIHSYLYGSPKLDLRDEESYSLQFALRIPSLPGPGVWIIDEASMIGDEVAQSETMRFGSGRLLFDLVQAARLLHRPDDRIIFVGDPAQLPPVAAKEGLSPALDAAYLRDTYGLRVREAQLTQVRRQAEGSGILLASQYLRNQIDQGRGSALKLPEGPGIQAIDGKGLVDLFPWLTLEQHPMRCIVLTHSNDQAFFYNQFIRRHRFGQPDLPVQPGDWLMVDRNCQVDGITLFNGTHIRVLSVGPAAEERTISLKARNRQPAYVVVFRFRKLLMEVPHPETGELLTCQVLLLDNALENRSRLDSRDQQALFVDFRIRNPQWRPEEPQAVEMLMKDPYFNALQARYGYAITVHKAQGGEWPEVFVNFDLKMPAENREKWRWAYTAVTRARQLMYGLFLELFQALPEVVVEPVQVLEQAGPEARYTPALPPTPGMPDVFLKYPFLHLRSREIMVKGRQMGLTVHCDPSQPGRLRFTFGQGASQATVDIPYSREGLRTPLRPRGEDRGLKEKAKAIVHDYPLYTIPEVPPEGPRRIWYEHLRRKSAEEGWGFSHFYQLQGLDRYWVKSPMGYLRFDLFFNGKGIPTNLFPHAEAAALHDLELWLTHLTTT